MKTLLFIVIIQFSGFIFLGAQGLASIQVREQGLTFQFPDADYNFSDLSLITYQIEDQIFSNLNPHPNIAISIKAKGLVKSALHFELQFENKGSDTLLMHNILPFGDADKEAYITGLGDHYLSRSHLFLPDRKPLNCILPDNAWELGYTGFEIAEGIKITGLSRRRTSTIENGKRRRFETDLYPNGSVVYDLYVDTYQGIWQVGLRKMFQEYFLFDASFFDDSIYKRPDLAWIRDAYVIHLVMAWDQHYRAPGTFAFSKFLDRGKKWYGGDDLIGLWPTWPSLGLDQRNQFDLYRDLPGGLDQLKKDIQQLHAQGTRFFIAYNPWDESTNKEDHLISIETLVGNLDADGVILDTRGSSSKALQAAADRAKEGVVMYSEGMAVPKDMQGIISGRVHNALYYPPLLNLNKLIRPDFSIFRVAELAKEPINREYASAFFNGYGTELNIFAAGQPDWIEEQYQFLGKTTRILREHSANFKSWDFSPLVPTLRDDIFVNYWPLRDKKVYTIFSLIPEGFKAPLFAVEPDTNSHYVDVYHHQLIEPEEKNGTFYLEIETAAFHQKYLGTNNEGAVTCIVEFQKLLNSHLEGDLLSISVNKGDTLKIWAGNPSYAKQAKVFPIGQHILSMLDLFGTYEGKIVIQVFQGKTLIDEDIHFLKPGTPRLRQVLKRSGKRRSDKAGMVKIPAGNFVFKTSNGDEFIAYPQYRQGKQYKMASFWMDKFPVTNAQFEAFVKGSKYQPIDNSNFLKHWPAGQLPDSLANLPVVYVSYEDAQAYAKWANKRLPTEIEWQYAAQTGDGRSWPWEAISNNIYREEEYVTNTLTVKRIKGIDPKYCNLGNNRLDPVGSYPAGANPFGVEDLVGTVWQLTDDWYRSGSYDFIILKGGSYFNPSSSWWYVQGGPRELDHRQFLLRVSQGFERNATVGFRCISDE